MKRNRMMDREKNVNILLAAWVNLYVIFNERKHPSTPHSKHDGSIKKHNGFYLDSQADESWLPVLQLHRREKRKREADDYKLTYNHKITHPHFD